MNRFLGTLKRMLSQQPDRPPDLEATLADLRSRTPAPAFWLIGKTQSGKTTIIKFLTGAEDAVIGSGFRPTTRTTRRYQFPEADAPLLTFLDTRGLDEPGYDPANDITVLDPMANLVIATAKATDFAQANVRATLQSVRSANPSRPVVLCITHLHETIPRQQHPSPYPFGPLARGEASPAEPIPGVPDDMKRCIEHHAESFQGLYDHLVPIDLTKPEEGFTQANYGGEQLKETLLQALPEAYRQTLLRLGEATQTLKDIHLRHAIPIILGYSSMAATAGAAPVPFLDMLMIPSIQARMAQHIARLYGQRMNVERYREIAAAIGVGVVSRQLARQATKFIPLVGSAIGAAVGGASTYALGRALCYYFQAVCEGHIPDAASLENYYREQYTAAEKEWKK
jgi:uncharacterized protein (DUF697 family)